MIIFVATDLWGIKDNLKLEFNSRPATLSHLTDRIEAAYQAEVIRLAPPDIDRRSIPRFTVECITLLVDDGKSVWVELFALKQLYSRCQLFAFQPANSFHSDSRGVLPPPREPVIGSGPSMPGHFAPLALPLLDVAHITFHRLNKPGPQNGNDADTVDFGGFDFGGSVGGGGGGGYSQRIRTTELKAAMVMIGFKAHSLPPNIAGRVAIDFPTWLKFCHTYPAVAEALVRVGTVDPALVRGGNSNNNNIQSMMVSPQSSIAAALMNTSASAMQQRQLSANRHPGAYSAAFDPLAIQASPLSTRDMSPQRRQLSKTDKQRIAAERLSGGLSVSITARDRKDDVVYEAYQHQLTVGPASSRSSGRRPTSPTSSSRAGSAKAGSRR